MVKSSSQSLRTSPGFVPLLAGSLVTAVLLGGAAHAQTITGFGGFSLNGGAAVTNNVLTLTDGGSNEGRSGFNTSTVNYAGSFTSSFTYTASGNKAADGVAFVLQNSTNGASALGSVGGGLGYNGITPSVAIELNLYNGGGTNIPGTNYATNGVTGIYNTTGPVNLASGHAIQVDLAYSGRTHSVTQTLTDATANTSYATQYNADLGSVLNSGTAYVGFTGGSGGATATQQISNFTYTGTAAQAQTLSFRNLVDTSASGTAAPGGTKFDNFFGYSVGEKAVAFEAFYNNSNGRGIFTGGTGGGAITTLATDSTTAPDGSTFATFLAFTISGNTVAFLGNTTNNTESLYTESAGGGTIISRVTPSTLPPGGGTFNGFNSIALSGSTVAFQAPASNGVRGVYTQSTSGANVTAIATTNTVEPGGTKFSNFPGPVIISGNTAVFLANYNTNQSTGLFSQSTSGGGPTTLAAKGAIAPDGTAFIGFQNALAISGTVVAFEAGSNNGSTDGIYTESTSGGNITSLVTTGTKAPDGSFFSSFGASTISGGTVAFIGNFSSSSKTGLFTESVSGGAYTTLLQTGDSLFGSTVTGLSLSDTGKSFDNQGNLAFGYTLANGISGIADTSYLSSSSATPEPGSLALLTLTGLPVAGVVVRRRRARVA